MKKICTLFVLALAGIALTATRPADASPVYRAYAQKLLAHLPPGVKPRPDLEVYLDQLAVAARRRAGRSPLKPGNAARLSARAQALEMLIGKFVGHSTKSGFQFRDRFTAFAGEGHGDFGENAARDRQPGPVGRAKAARLFKQWLDSAGHKRNLMNRFYTRVSTGVFQAGHHLYAVQIFWEK